MSNPTLRELLAMPGYRQHVLAKAPHLQPNLRHGLPWRVWAIADDGKVGKKDLATYREAFDLVKRLLPLRADVTITSLRQLYGPSTALLAAGFGWSPGQGWCSRCRRPVTFSYFRKHPACKGSLYESIDLATDARCPYCGIRRSAMREY